MHATAQVGEKRGRPSLRELGLSNEEQHERLVKQRAQAAEKRSERQRELVAELTAESLPGETHLDTLQRMRKELAALRAERDSSNCTRAAYGDDTSSDASAVPTPPPFQTPRAVSACATVPHTPDSALSALATAPRDGRDCHTMETDCTGTGTTVADDSTASRVDLRGVARKLTSPLRKAADDNPFSWGLDHKSAEFEDRLRVFDPHTEQVGLANAHPQLQQLVDGMTLDKRVERTSDDNQQKKHLGQLFNTGHALHVQSQLCYDFIFWFTLVLLSVSFDHCSASLLAVTSKFSLTVSYSLIWGWLAQRVVSNVPAQRARRDITGHWALVDDNIEVMLGYKDANETVHGRSILQGMFRFVFQMRMPKGLSRSSTEAARPQSYVYYDAFDLEGATHHPETGRGRWHDVRDRKIDMFQTFIAKYIGLPTDCRAPKQAEARKIPPETYEKSKIQVLAPLQVQPSSHVGTYVSLEQTLFDMGTSQAELTKTQSFVFAIADDGVNRRRQEKPYGISAKEVADYNAKHKDAPVQVGAVLPRQRECVMHSPGMFHFLWNFLKLVFLICWYVGLDFIRYYLEMQQLNEGAENYQASLRFMEQVWHGMAVAFFIRFCELRGLGRRRVCEPDGGGKPWVELELIAPKEGWNAERTRSEAVQFLDWLCNAGVRDEMFRFWGEQFLTQLGFGVRQLLKDIRLGDGDDMVNIMLVAFPFFLMMRRRNYVALTLNFLANVFCRWPLYWATLAIANMTLSVSGRKFHNQACDMVMEWHVHLGKLWHPKTWVKLLVVGSCSDLLLRIKSRITGIVPQLVSGSTHKTRSSDRTVAIIAYLLLESDRVARITDVVDGRKLTVLGIVPTPKENASTGKAAGKAAERMQRTADE